MIGSAPLTDTRERRFHETTCRARGCCPSLSGYCVVAATATTSASTPGPCGSLGLKEQRIVGGNNLKANNPGNAGSMDWLRGTGDRASFNVPVGPILRKDCLGEVGGILVKMRFADDAGNLTAADYTVGLWYSNTPNEAGALEWGVSYGSNSSGDFESNGPQHMTSKIIVGQCGLTAGDHVTLRIVADTDGSGNHGWNGQCLGTGGTTWFSMDPITPVHVNIYSTGIALVNRWRLGGVGGLGLDASALKYADFNGSWGRLGSFKLLRQWQLWRRVPLQHGEQHRVHDYPRERQHGLLTDGFCGWGRCLTAPNRRTAPLAGIANAGQRVPAVAKQANLRRLQPGRGSSWARHLATAATSPRPTRTADHRRAAEIPPRTTRRRTRRHCDQHQRTAVVARRKGRRSLPRPVSRTSTTPNRG